MKKFFLVLVIIIAWVIFAVNPSQDKTATPYTMTKAQPISEIAEGPKILVLNYHQINDNFSYISVPINDFDAQMNYLTENGYIAITPDALLSSLEGELELPPKPMLITFDDGYIDNYTNAFPILQKYGLRATVFVIPALVGKNGYMDWDQLKEMEENGITVQSHTLNHIALENLSDDGLRVELLNSKLMLEEKFGHPVDFVAYPTGTYNLHIAEIANEVGYKGAFTIKYGNVDLGSNFFALERVPIFHTPTTMKDFYERIEYRQSFEEFGWIKK